MNQYHTILRDMQNHFGENLNFFLFLALKTYILNQPLYVLVLQTEGKSKVLTIYSCGRFYLFF